MKRLAAMQAEYAANPPPEFFLSLYFRAKFGWKPPEPDSPRARGNAQMPEPLPLYE